jgi:hypothetical protein
MERLTPSSREVNGTSIGPLRGQGVNANCATAIATVRLPVPFSLALCRATLVGMPSRPTPPRVQTPKLDSRTSNLPTPPHEKDRD